MVAIGDTWNLMEHYPLQTGVATGGDTKDVVSRAADFSRHQEVSPPLDCRVSYEALPTRDTSRNTTAVDKFV